MVCHLRLGTLRTGEGECALPLWGCLLSMGIFECCCYHIGNCFLQITLYTILQGIASLSCVSESLFSFLSLALLLTVRAQPGLRSFRAGFPAPRSVFYCNAAGRACSRTGRRRRTETPLRYIFASGMPGTAALALPQRPGRFFRYWSARPQRFFVHPLC